MDRPPDRPPPRRPLERAAAADAEPTGSLPPWSSLGLGPDADPELDPTWWPLPEGGQEARQGGPRPLPIRHRNGPAIVALVAAVGVVALVIYGLLRADFGFGGGDDDDDPGRDAGLVATSDGTPDSTARVVTTATAPASEDGAGPTPGGTTTAAVPDAAGSPAASTGGAILLSVDAVTVDGVAAADVAAGIEGALTSGGGRVETAGPEGAANATIVVGATAPGDGFDVQPVASRVLALVTSPRLPLFGVGESDAARLLGGEVADWREVGAAASLPVEPLALADVAPAGLNATETYDDYEALVAGLADHPGGVALIPLELVDFQVNVLSVAGIDPLRDGDSIDAYPYLERLYVGVRTSEASTLQPAVDTALQGLQLPRSENAEPVTSVGVVGDIVPGRNVHQKMEERDDFTYPFQAVAGQLSSYDLTFANLEGDLSETIEQPDDAHTFAFVSDPRMIDGLKLAGIDCVTLANNHSMNFGIEGLTDTMAALRDAEMPYVGAGQDLDEARQVQYFDVNGITVALLGINGITANPDVSLPGVVSDTEGATADTPGTNPLVADQYLADIEEAAERADVVIPYFHMGIEYTSVPPEWAIEVAHAAIDAGATLVVANHPHWIQGMEIYKGRPIVYSLGNFIFDQMFSVEVRQGMILEITLRGDEVVGLRFHGVEIEDFSRPRPMTGDEQAALMDRFWASTDRLNQQIEQRD